MLTLFGVAKGGQRGENRRQILTIDFKHGFKIVKVAFGLGVGDSSEIGKCCVIYPSSTPRYLSNKLVLPGWLERMVLDW